jgi:glycosyltransferase involved in cell wall biosynthesis
MRIDVIARSWGSPAGGANGMAIAAAFFACTLADLGHEVRRLESPQGFGADLVITTVSPTWRRVASAAEKAGATDRLVYWHHAGGVPDGRGCILAAPPSVSPSNGWARHVVLPPSSWAAEAGGDRTGSEILVAGAGPAKGGHIALAVASACPDLRWYVLRGRSSEQDRAGWRALPNAEVAEGLVAPAAFLSRASAVLAPTRFEVHPLVLVEAAVRGIPIVCTDMPATRCAAQDSAFYVPMNAPTETWATALRAALQLPLPRLRLRPYAEVAQDAISALVDRRAAA